jgi:hypothetical protein
MNIVPFMEFLPHLTSNLSLNSNSVGMLACLIGMAAGLYLTNRQQQLKAKKAKIERKDELTRRD